MNEPAKHAYLTFSQVVAGAQQIIGTNAQLRDAGLLDSALHRPATVAFDVEAYPTLHEKAAALMHSMVMNHPFVDGNKRMGWAVTEAFYRLNGYTFAGTEDEAFDLVLAVAKGLSDVPAIVERLAPLFAPR